MAYTQRWGGGFVNGDGALQVDAIFLNAVETALLKLQAVDPTVDGQALQWDAVNSRFGPALLLNKNIDAAAAIDKSKLNLTGSIVDADVAGAANIAGSKLASIPPSKLVAYPTDATKVLRGDSSWAVPAGTRLDYAQIVASVNFSATTEGAATTIIDGASVTYDGSLVRVEFWSPDVLPPASIDVYIVLLRDATVLGRAKIDAVAGSQPGQPTSAVFYDTPSAAAHTYHVKAYLSSAGTGTVLAGAGGATTQLPAFLAVFKA